MIKRIELKVCPPYQNAELTDCKKINFVFGANGSGKSTIGSFLKGDYPQRFENCSIEWDSVSHETICVYNRDFRRSNFKQTIPGVFTMGSATIDDIDELEQLKKKYETEKDEWIKLYDEYRKQVDDVIPERERQFTDDSWMQILKTNESEFQKAFEGLRGSKERFVGELKRRILLAGGGAVCQRSDLKARANALYVGNPIKCDLIDSDVNSWLGRIEEIRDDSIWETVITGKEDIDIASLINELGNSSWVYQGSKYIQSGSPRCPFCQQNTITDQFRKKLESFFDEAYNRKMDKMKALRTEYCDLAKMLISKLQRITDNALSISIGSINKEVLSAKIELVNRLFIDQNNLIEEKIKEPEKRIMIQDVSEVVRDIQNLIETANTKIEAHNRLVEEKATEERKLTEDVWATIIHESSPMINSYRKEVEKLTKDSDDMKRNLDLKKADIDSLQDEIIDKTKNLTSVQPAIDEINRALRAYGFTSFSIQPAEGQENYYCIKRSDGTLASDTLSEGEETFLTFLYFMQWTKGSINPDHVSDKKIIVLDDPISSLDSTILYIVGAMIKDLAKQIAKGKGDVSQLFVLTHNVFFHKEASFVDGRARELKFVSYWIIRKNDDVSSITAYGKKNPISTSYELLWNELRDNADASLISIQNTMRRIIENYFNIIGGNGQRNDYLVDRFESVEDKIIAKSLLYWIDDGSHSIPDDLFVDPYSDAIPRYKKVFKQLFINSGHEAHYNMMMKTDDDSSVLVPSS